MKINNDNIYKIVLGISVVLYAGLFFGLALLRHHSFFSYEWEDQGEINRVLWCLSQGSLTDLFYDYMPTGTYYKVHMAFLLAIMALFYKIYPHIETLFFLTSCALAVSAIPIFLIAQKLLKSKAIALLLALAYLFYAPKHSLNFLDGDTIIYLIPFLLFAFYAAISSKTKWLFFFMALTLLAKTDSPIFVIVFAGYLFIQRGKGVMISKKTCGILALSGVAFLIAYLYLYAKHSTSTLYDALYSRSFTGAVTYALEYPLDFISKVHQRTFLQLFWPVLFLPIFSLELYIGLPSIALVLLTQNFVFQRAHYVAGLIPFIFIGTIYVMRRFAGRPRTQLFLSVAVLAGCILSNFGSNIIGAPFPPEAGVIQDTRFVSAKNVFDKRFYVQDEGDKIAWKMIKMFPEDASVAASGDLVAPLSSRQRIFEFLDTTYDYYNVDYILLHNKNMYLGAGHYEWNDERMARELKALLSNKAWDLMHQEGDFFLFKKIKKG
jgi:uncharacterized membrane protein